MTSLNILQIDDGMSWGGGQDQVRLLAEGLVQRGVNSCVATPRGSELSKRLAPHVRQLALSPVRALMPLNVARVASFCRAHAIDVIDVHTGSGYALGLFAKLLAPHVKLVLHRHIDTKIKQRAMTRFKYLHDAVDAFVAVSEAVRLSLLEYGVAEEKISVCWGGVDANLYSLDSAAEARVRLLKMTGFRQDAFLTGSVGRLVAQKDYPTLLEAIALARCEEPRIHAIFIGEGEDCMALEAQAASLNIAAHVKFLGFQANVAQLIGGLGVFVLPSIMEGFGLVLVEAALSGSCLVTSDIRSVRDFAENNQTALTFAAKDPKDLAAKLLALYRNPGMRDDLQKRALALARGQFTAQHMIDRNLAEYQKIMQRADNSGATTQPEPTFAKARPPQ